MAAILQQCGLPELEKNIEVTHTVTPSWLQGSSERSLECHFNISLCTYPDNILVYHHQTAEHGQIGQHGEDGKEPKILDEDKQNHKWQQRQDV